MTINEIILQNFGVYAGQRSIDLRPKSKKAPVILVGALNGGGKTTLLDAIQLVLFGKLSKCSTRENYSYNEFLKRSITRGSDLSEGSMVALNIRHGFDGSAHDFYIERRWRHTQKGVVESLTVMRDGILDKNLSGNWLEYVDHFVPVGLAELFFFDGEKLEQLAQSNNAAKMLSTAINSLLGLDLVDRLEQDLVAYQKDLNKKRKSKTELAEIESEEKKLKDLEKDLEELYQGTRTKAIGLVDKTEKRRIEAEDNFAKNGGDIFESRKAIEAQKSALKEEQARIGDQMRKQAAGLLPLLLVEEQLETITEQAEAENLAENNTLLHETLLEQKEKLSKQLKKWKAETELTKKISGHLNHEIIKLRQSNNMSAYLDLDKSEYIAFKRLDKSTFEFEARNAQSLTEQSDKLAEEIQSIDDKLARVPDDQAIAAFAKELAKANSEHEKAKAELAVVEEQYCQKIQSNCWNESSISSSINRSLRSSVVALKRFMALRTFSAYLIFRSMRSEAESRSTFLSKSL